MMAANNYFGFAHGGTQYGAPAAGAAYGGQTGYAVAPAATAATYGTQRAAAAGYDTYQAAATQGTYAAAHAHVHAAAHHAAAQSAYDASKSYYQQAAVAAYPTPAAPAPPTYDATPKPAYTASASYAQAGANRAAVQAKPAQYGGAYSTSGGVVTAAAAPYGAAQQYATPATTHVTHTTQPAKANTANATSLSGYDTALYNAATMYVAQQKQGGGGGGWQAYRKGSNSGGGMQRRPKPPPKAQQLHYCDVCRISCAGPQTYREHIEGQKHKKKEASVKLAASASNANASRSSATSSLRCELCDVLCTGADAYAAHVRGIKHQKVVKLHTILGKPIPSQEPKVMGAKKTVSGTPKINFVSSGGLSTVAGTNAGAAESTVEASNTDNAGGESIDESEAEPEILPVGQDYIEEIEGADGKVLSFNCKLCDCKFNDPNAKEMHMKGRRHRLQYKKKVQPDLVVDVKPSARHRKLVEQKAHRMLIREELWARRRMHESEIEEEERMFWEERRRFSSEFEYAEWCRRPMPLGAPPLVPPHGPMRPGMVMQFGPFGPPPPGRRPESGDDRHVLAQHATIYPQEKELADIQRIVSHTERALKAVSDVLVDQAHKNNKVTPKIVKQEDKKNIIKKEDEKQDAKEDGRDNQLFSFVGEGEVAGGSAGAGAVGVAPGSGVRALKGVMRVGLLAKGLLLRGDRDVRLVVLCADRPTIALLKRVATELPIHLNKIKMDEGIKYKVELVPAEGAVTVTDGNINVLVSLTSPVMREPSECGGRDDKDVLPRQKCLDALAALRHSKWFQARAANLQSCVIIIRIMRDLCRRLPNWTPLNPWAMELLVEKVINSAGVPLSPGEALRRFMEAVAGGLLLEQGPGLMDPCEKETHDALGNLAPQKREDLTASAQQFLRQIAFRQIHKVLDMEPLILKRSNGPWNKYPRKRRRSTSDAEGEGKMVKTEKTDTTESK